MAAAAAAAAAVAAEAVFRGARYLPPSPLSVGSDADPTAAATMEPGPTNLRTHRFRARTGGQRGRTGTDAAGTWRRASAPVARAPGSRKVRLRGGDELWKPAPTPTRSLTLPTSSLPHKNFGKRELTAPPAGAAVVPA